MRHIILRELAPSSTFEITPPHSYIDGTNGTLERLPVMVSIDSDGFMVTNRIPSPDDSVVLILGGSSIENLYIHADKRINAVIERLLEYKNVPTRVLNGGVSDMHLLHAMNVLLNKGLDAGLDALVLFPTTSLDVLANETKRSFWQKSNNFLTPIRTPGVTTEGTNFVKKYKNIDGFRLEKQLLMTLIDMCRNFNIDLTLTTWPIYEELDAFAQKFLTDRSDVSAVNIQFRNLNNVIRECAAGRNVRLLDLENIFEGLPHADYFYDWNHPNIKGCSLIGMHTSNALLETLAKTKQ